MVFSCLLTSLWENWLGCLEKNVLCLCALTVDDAKTTENEEEGCEEASEVEEALNTMEVGHCGPLHQVKALTVTELAIFTF